MAKKIYSIVDMVVLGILKKEPMNAYKLAQFVEKHNVTRLVKLSTPALYKSCKRLHKKGYLSGELQRDGEAPEKTIYNVTKEGDERFREMMSHFAGTISPFYFDINSVIYSLEQLSYEEGVELIDTYENEIKTMQSWLIPHSEDVKAKATFASRMIVKQYLMVVDVLVKWVKLLREDFIKERR